MSIHGKKMVEVYDGWEIPVPLGLTPEQEAEAVARFKAEYPPERIAAEMAMAQAVLDGTDPEATTLAQLIQELQAELRAAKDSA